MFTTLLDIAGSFVMLIGIVTCFSWILPLKHPADKSNRINRIRLWWFSIKAPHIFAPHFQWMRGDERDNLNG